MPITFHGDGTMTIDDPEIEANVSQLCSLTGETPTQAGSNGFCAGSTCENKKES